MFQSTKQKIQEVEEKPGTINIIGAGTEIKGTLVTNGDIRIDGKINGDLKSKAKVVVSNSGEITGNIYSNVTEVSGTIKGDINTVELLYLKSTARVLGNIFSNKLIVENGATFTGHCQTGLSEEIESVLNDNDANRGRSKQEEATA